MQHSAQEKNSMHVPNWLIALELGAGAALLYISSSALVNTDMHVSRNIRVPANLVKLENPPSTFDRKIILSAHSGATIFTK